jgi:hypothetical protein
MRVLFWFCDRIGWQPALKTVETAEPAEPARHAKVVAAFVHVEPADVAPASKAATKLVKNAKWLARKWGVTRIVLHSFTHLGEAKASADEARDLLQRVGARLMQADYEVVHTPFGYFLDLDIRAPGHPLARVFKQFDPG